MNYSEYKELLEDKFATMLVAMDSLSVADSEMEQSTLKNLLVDDYGLKEETLDSINWNK